MGEALFGVVLLFKMQPQLASVFALVIPTVATITARLGQRLIKASIKEVGRGRPRAGERERQQDHGDVVVSV